ncbi:hypothetical protein BT69DRAFT_1344127, partial [Atractiella rhizophila]
MVAEEEEDEWAMGRERSGTIRPGQGGGAAAVMQVQEESAWGGGMEEFGGGDFGGLGAEMKEEGLDGSDFYSGTQRHQQQQQTYNQSQHQSYDTSLSYGSQPQHSYDAYNPYASPVVPSSSFESVPPASAPQAEQARNVASPPPRVFVSPPPAASPPTSIRPMMSMPSFSEDPYAPPPVQQPIRPQSVVDPQSRRARMMRQQSTDSFSSFGEVINPSMGPSAGTAAEDRRPAVPS